MHTKFGAQANTEAINRRLGFYESIDLTKVIIRNGIIIAKKIS